MARWGPRECAIVFDIFVASVWHVRVRCSFSCWKSCFCAGRRNDFGVNAVVTLTNASGRCLIHTLGYNYATGETERCYAQGGHAIRGNAHAWSGRWRTNFLQLMVYPLIVRLDVHSGVSATGVKHWTLSFWIGLVILSTYCVGLLILLIGVQKATLEKKTKQFTSQIEATKRW